MCDECKDTGFVGDQNAGRGGRNTEYSYCDCIIGKQKAGTKANQVQAKVKHDFCKRNFTIEITESNGVRICELIGENKYRKILLTSKFCGEVIKKLDLEI